jgi:hypothetical protein
LSRAAFSAASMHVALAMTVATSIASATLYHDDGGSIA